MLYFDLIDNYHSEYKASLSNRLLQEQTQGPSKIIRWRFNNLFYNYRHVNKYPSKKACASDKMSKSK